MKKRGLSALGIFFVIPAIFMIFLCRNSSVDGSGGVDEIRIAEYRYSDFENPLPVPPLLKNRDPVPGRARYSLKVQNGETEFFKGRSVYTLGYNGALLGPTIRMKRGERVRIDVSNELHEVTTVHWHGMLVPAEMDGGPHQVIKPGTVWRPSFRVNQPAATLWYHPHGHGTTAVQVYRGLAGMIIIEDEESKKLNLPSDYGVNDIPLIVQDRRFTSEGVPVYITSMRDIMEGMKGNTIIVNGVVNPVLEVSKGSYRFRLLNGSNARVYNFRFTDGLKFSQIATDGGLMERPYHTDSLLLSPGERGEIVVDFTGMKTGRELYLVSGGFSILKLVVKSDTLKSSPLPEILTVYDKIPIAKVSRERYFSLLGMGHGVNINGRRYYTDRIDETVKYNSVEIWNIMSRAGHMGMMGGGMMGGNVFHNFHAHGVQFMILNRGGGPPAGSESGWKDTILLNEGEPVSVIMRFLYRGVFMYHCHILEHEDNGMMGQFLVK